MISFESRGAGFYCGGAKSTDRFIALPCGCIVLLRDWELMPADVSMQGEPVLTCPACYGVPPTTLGGVLASWVRTVYTYATEEESIGVYWQ
jgi:hypothetical protein